MQRQSLFSTFQNVNQRENIWFSIISIDNVISFIYTFLKNIKHLEICVKILKKLLSCSLQKTIHQTFYELHNDQKTLKIQLTENYYENLIETSSEIAHWKAYRQLWLYIMRHFSEMNDHSSRTENFKLKSESFNSKYCWWYEIFALIRDCEYKKVQKRFSSEVDANMQMIKDFLLRIRSFFVFRIENAHFDRKLKRIIIVLHEKDMYRTKQKFSDTSNKTSTLFNVDISHRCDVSFWFNFVVDRSRLFLNRIYYTNEIDKVMIVKKFMFKKFFENLNFREFEASRAKEKSFTIFTISELIRSLSMSKVVHDIHLNLKDRIFTNSSLFDFTETIDIDHTISTKSTNTFVLRQTSRTFSYVNDAIFKSLIVNKSNEKSIEKSLKTRFKRSIRSNVCTLLKNFDISKVKTLSLYNEFKKKKDDNVLYVFKEDNAIEKHFSLYKCRSHDIEKLFEILNIKKFIFSMFIKQEDKYKIVEHKSNNFKKVKMSSMQTITSQNSYCVIVTKKNTQITFEKDRLQKVKDQKQHEMKFEYFNIWLSLRMLTCFLFEDIFVFVIVLIEIYLEYLHFNIFLFYHLNKMFVLFFQMINQIFVT